MEIINAGKLGTGKSVAGKIYGEISINYFVCIGR
jgi:hypothetical protein